MHAVPAVRCDTSTDVEDKKPDLDGQIAKNAEYAEGVEAEESRFGGLRVAQDGVEGHSVPDQTDQDEDCSRVSLIAGNVSCQTYCSSRHKTKSKVGEEEA